MCNTGDQAMSKARSFFHLLLAKALTLLLVVAPLSGSGSEKVCTDQHTVLQYRFPLPLGADGYFVERLHRPFFLLASADDPGVQNVSITRAHLGGSVKTPDGSELRHYPDQTTFRVTASALDPALLTTDLEPVAYDGDMNSLLLNLNFRLKVYRALQMKMIKPVRVVQIGMPADVPYDERVYRVSFDTSDIPVDARLVLEVLSPTGDRLSRFHFELL